VALSYSDVSCAERVKQLLKAHLLHRRVHRSPRKENGAHRAMCAMSPEEPTNLLAGAGSCHLEA
jgi:hypothetical protein